MFGHRPVIAAIRPAVSTPSAKLRAPHPPAMQSMIIVTKGCLLLSSPDAITVVHEQTGLQLGHAREHLRDADIGGVRARPRARDRPHRDAVWELGVDDRADR